MNLIFVQYIEKFMILQRIRNYTGEEGKDIE